MQIKYQYIEEAHLLIQKFTGNFLINFYQENIKTIYQNINIKETKRVLIDLREMILQNADIPLLQKNIQEMICFRKKINKELLLDKEVCLVMWVDTPLQTVISQLFTRNFAGKQYSYCSSEPTVKHQLGLPTDFDLTTKIEHLRNIMKSEN